MIHIIFKLCCFIYVYFLFIKYTDSSFHPEGKRPVVALYVKPGEAPYVVLVDTVYTKCTGTLISDLWVITTASCVQDSSYNLRETISIVAGILDYESKENYTSRQERTVVKTIIFPGYKDLRSISALTLLKVNQSFHLNNLVWPVKTQSRSWPKIGENSWKCSFFGFGDIDYALHDPQLKIANIKVKNAARSCHCTKRYQWKYVLCIPYKEDVSLCQSDIGGPIVCQGELVGVALRLHNRSTCLIHTKPNEECGKLSTISLFIYLCPYLEWIHNNTHALNPQTFPSTCKGSSTIINYYLINFIILLYIYSSLFLNA